MASRSGTLSSPIIDLTQEDDRGCEIVELISDRPDKTGVSEFASDSGARVLIDLTGAESGKIIWVLD
jgi:folate-dependent phosphoribosylglycinamide formyltransferase PurN